MCNTIVPAGFKFLPRDNKLIKYRICKIHNEPLPYEGIISEVDNVFGDHRPLWELFGGGIGGIIVWVDFNPQKLARQKSSTLDISLRDLCNLICTGSLPSTATAYKSIKS
ncbi:hypothetical protein LguiA_032960 [Lonicera macranthoides]